MRRLALATALVTCGGDPAPAPLVDPPPPPPPEHEAAPPPVGTAPRIELAHCVVELAEDPAKDLPDMSWESCPEEHPGTCARTLAPLDDAASLHGEDNGLLVLDRGGRDVVLAGWKGPLAALSLRGVGEGAHCRLSYMAASDRGLALAIAHGNDGPGPEDGLGPTELALLTGPDPWRIAAAWKGADPMRLARVVAHGPGWISAGEEGGLTHVTPVGLPRPFGRAEARYHDVASLDTAVLAVEDDGEFRLVRLIPGEPDRREVLHEPPPGTRLALAVDGNRIALLLRPREADTPPTELLVAPIPATGEPLRPALRADVPIDGRPGALGLSGGGGWFVVRVYAVSDTHRAHSDLLLYDGLSTHPRRPKLALESFTPLGQHGPEYYVHVDHEPAPPPGRAGNGWSLRRYDVPALAAAAERRRD